MVKNCVLIKRVPNGFTEESVASLLQQCNEELVARAIIVAIAQGNCIATIQFALEQAARVAFSALNERCIIANGSQFTLHAQLSSMEECSTYINSAQRRKHRPRATHNHTSEIPPEELPDTLEFVERKFSDDLGESDTSGTGMSRGQYLHLLKHYAGTILRSALLDIHSSGNRNIHNYSFHIVDFELFYFLRDSGRPSEICIVKTVGLEPSIIYTTVIDPGAVSPKHSHFSERLTKIPHNSTKKFAELLPVKSSSEPFRKEVLQFLQLSVADIASEGASANSNADSKERRLIQSAQDPMASLTLKCHDVQGSFRAYRTKAGALLYMHNDLLQGTDAASALSPVNILDGDKPVLFAKAIAAEVFCMGYLGLGNRVTILEVQPLLGHLTSHLEVLGIAKNNSSECNYCWAHRKLGCDRSLEVTLRDGTREGRSTRSKFAHTHCAMDDCVRYCYNAILAAPDYHLALR